MNNEYYKGKVNGTANGIAIGILMSMFLIIGVKCSAQSGETGPLPIAPPTYDTIPVSLLVRIQGRPWAFFHDGWEVRKVIRLEPKYYVDFNGDTIRMNPNNCGLRGCVAIYDGHKTIFTQYSHLLYLDSKKRPIRKEWVVYNKYQRQ